MKTLKKAAIVILKGCVCLAVVVLVLGPLRTYSQLVVYVIVIAGAVLLVSFILLGLLTGEMWPDADAD